MIPADSSSPAVIHLVLRNSLCGTASSPNRFDACVRPQFHFKKYRENADFVNAEFEIGSTGLVDRETKGCVTFCSSINHTLIT